jgi:chromosomal replication initiator protein
MKPETLIARTADTYGLTVAELTSARRRRDISQARMVAAYILRKTTELSLVEIGRQLGGRDHTTILYGLAQVEKRRRLDWEYAREIDEIIGRPTLQLERADPAVADWLKECGL